MKQIGLLLAGIVLGGVITYYYLKSETISFKSSHPTKEKFLSRANGTKVINWDPVETDVAKEWLKNYKEESESLWYPLRVEESDEILRGFFIARDMIDQIIAQDSANCNGIRIYFAKKNGMPKRNYCTLFIATKSNEGPNGNPEDFGTFYDYVDPCPTNCGSSINTVAKKSTQNKK